MITGLLSLTNMFVLTSKVHKLLHFNDYGKLKCPLQWYYFVNNGLIETC